jgi:winged helix-turn-helix protein
MADEGKLNKFVGQILGDLGGASLASRANVNKRHVREWLSHQAASNYLTYDPVAATFLAAIDERR